MAEKYVLTNSRGDNLQVSKKFVYSCNVFKNMFEDLGEDTREELLELPITDMHDFGILKEFTDFFEILDNLSMENELGDTMTLLEYFDKYFSENENELAKNYFHKNIEFPHSNKLVEMYGNYKLITFLNMNRFFDNVKITKAICVCIVCFITKIQNQGEKANLEESKEVDNMINKILEAI